MCTLLSLHMPTIHINSTQPQLNLNQATTGKRIPPYASHPSQQRICSSTHDASNVTDRKMSKCRSGDPRLLSPLLFLFAFLALGIDKNRYFLQPSRSLTPACFPSSLPSHYRANTLTTPSPPALTTHRPSWLHATEHTPSPRISLWLVISWVQLRFSRLQNRRLASWPADTSSRPSGDSDSDEIAAGCASMLYVHWPIFDMKSAIGL